MADDLKVYSFSLGPLGANCFIVASQGRCLIIDPGDEAHKVVDFLDRAGLTPLAILVTHGHFDHFGAVQSLARRFGLPVYVGAADAAQVVRPELGPLGGFPVEGVSADVATLQGEQELDLPIPVTAIPTPGHSSGAYTFVVGDHLFVGDLLFYGSIGRTDLPGGDFDELLKSVALLAGRYPPDAVVHCGHGPDTSLRRELTLNPFLSALRRGQGGGR